MRSISQIKALSLLAQNARPVVQSLMLGIRSRKCLTLVLAKQKKIGWVSATFGKVEDLRAHAAKCKKATPDAQLAARVQQVKAGGGSEKSSSQMSLNLDSIISPRTLVPSLRSTLQNIASGAAVLGGQPPY